MKKVAIIVLGVILIFVIFFWNKGGSVLPAQSTNSSNSWWQFQAIDTMKYSRDPSLAKLNDPSFDTEIEKQIKAIKETGATHVGIATPYDEKFLPILGRWVRTSRKHDLKIWFRGNFSGWEKWFGYSSIDRETHKKLLAEFITNNPGLFQDGDVFSPCPECENGGAGDPRQTGDVAGFRRFMIEEHEISKKSFSKIGKDVATNYASMNLDVAKVIMDKETTAAMDGLVVIDHYVKSPQKIASDVAELAQNSGGKIVLGEFGAPIPDIHGDITPQEQAKWISDTLTGLASSPDLVGLSYWTSFGGSTKLWNDDGTARPAVATLQKFYNPKKISLTIRDSSSRPVKNAIVIVRNQYLTSSNTGEIHVPVIGQIEIQIVKDGYLPKTVSINDQSKSLTVVLEQSTKSTLWESILQLFGIAK